MKKRKEKDKSIIIMSIIFISLLLLIIFLGFKISSRKNEKIINLIIPVMKKDTLYDFGIDTVALNKEYTKEYTFKITNYRENSINKEEIPCHIVIENHTKNKIKVTRNDEEEDLIIDQESTVIEGILPKDEKEDVYFHVKLLEMEDKDTKDFVYIQIIS